MFHWKTSLLLTFSSLTISSIKRCDYAYASSRVKRKNFYGKRELQIFLLIFILVDSFCPPIWRLHTKLYKGVWNVSGNNSETVGYRDLRFGQIVYILVFYNICFSWHLPLDGFQFFAPCLLRTVERKNERDFFLRIKSTLSFPLILWALPIARFTAAFCWFIVRYKKNKIGKKRKKENYREY